MTYAEQTAVPVERSRAELERTLVRYGANAFGYTWEEEKAVVQFRAQDRYVRFILPMPNKADFAMTPGRRQRRAPAAQEKAWEQAQRQRWRALNLAVKAKLEAVEAGIATFEEEFLAHLLLPNGQTVGDWSAPQIAEAYERGTMPKMLPAGA